MPFTREKRHSNEKTRRIRHDRKRKQDPSVARFLLVIRIDDGQGCTGIHTVNSCHVGRTEKKGQERQGRQRGQERCSFTSSEHMGPHCVISRPLASCFWASLTFPSVAPHLRCRQCLLSPSVVDMSYLVIYRLDWVILGQSTSKSLLSKHPSHIWIAIMAWIRLICRRTGQVSQPQSRKKKTKGTKKRR